MIKAFWGGLLTWQRYAILVGAALLLAGGSILWIRHDAVSDYTAKTELKVEKKARKADQNAANRELKDQKEIAEMRDRNNEAINRNPDDPIRGLDCERLRRAGYNLDDLPSCRGR